MNYKTGYFYICKDYASGNYKIGKTVRPNTRLFEHKISNSNLKGYLYIVKLLGYDKFETHIKNKYVALQCCGEWFNFTDTHIENIKEDVKTFIKLVGVVDNSIDTSVIKEDAIMDATVDKTEDKTEDKKDTKEDATVDTTVDTTVDAKVEDKKEDKADDKADDKAEIKTEDKEDAKEDAKEDDKILQKSAKYTCAKCNKGFKKIYDFENHLARKTPCDKPKLRNFVCSICDKTFYRANIFNEHMRKVCVKKHEGTTADFGNNLKLFLQQVNPPDFPIYNGTPITDENINTILTSPDKYIREKYYELYLKDKSSSERSVWELDGSRYKQLIKYEGEWLVDAENAIFMKCFGIPIKMEMNKILEKHQDKNKILKIKKLLENKNYFIKNTRFAELNYKHCKLTTHIQLQM